MYQRPKFLKVLHEIRQQMARECDYDVDLFVQRLRVEPVRSELATKSVSKASPLRPRPHREKKARKEL
ncbi:MAG: hypothetical protein HY314_07450 [Acidobacteria bacterium]|nr:hypothetical protein [Acidobacteriota bacterium]